MNIGDLVIYESVSSDFIRIKVRILDLFERGGTEYAEVEPAEFKSIVREIPVSKLKPLR